MEERESKGSIRGTAPRLTEQEIDSIIAMVRADEKVKGLCGVCGKNEATNHIDYWAYGPVRICAECYEKYGMSPPNEAEMLKRLYPNKPSPTEPIVDKAMAWIP